MKAVLLPSIDFSLCTFSDQCFNAISEPLRFVELVEASR